MASRGLRRMYPGAPADVAGAAYVCRTICLVATFNDVGVDRRGCPPRGHRSAPVFHDASTGVRSISTGPGGLRTVSSTLDDVGHNMSWVGVPVVVHNAGATA